MSAPWPPRAPRRRAGGATPYGERCALLRAVARGIGERHLELAAVASARDRQVAHGVDRSRSQEAIDLIDDLRRPDGGQRRLRQAARGLVEGERNTDVLRPYGVFAVIAPFNFPVALVVGMPRAALIAGNTVVFKPSEEAPWTGAILGEIARGRACRRASSTSSTAARRPAARSSTRAIDGVAFTGSAEVGRAIARALQEGPYARPALTEMGGKNPAIVTASADLDAAAEGIARSAFGLSGQKCSACSRAIVLDDVHDEFVARLAAFSGDAAARRPGRARRLPRTRWSTRCASARFEDAVDGGPPRRRGSRPAAAGPSGPGISSSRRS